MLICLAAWTMLSLSSVGPFDAGSRVNPRFIGLGAFDRPLDLPYFRTGVQTHQFSSYDRAGDNYDADYFSLYKEPDGQCVLFDSYGPGCLYRLHANLWNGDLSGIRIRFTFDDEARPRIDMDVTKFFSPENPLGIFREPFAHVGGGYRFLYHPFLYRKHLKITLSKEPFGQEPRWDVLPWLGRYDQHPVRRNHWYNFTYQTFSDDPGIESWTKPADLSSVESLWDPTKIGQPIAPNMPSTRAMCDLALDGKSSGIAFALNHPGTVVGLRVTADDAALFDTRLVIRFDKAPKPQVDVPLGSFFGVYRTRPEKRIASRYVGAIGRDMYCYLPMPFWKGATVSFVRKPSGSPVHVHAELEYAPPAGLKYLASQCGYFHAIYQREDPRTEGHDYRYVDVRGRGHVVGHFTYRTDTSMEEDERTYFDGSQSPWIYGEGFEDDHNQGWGLRDAQQAIWGSTGSDGGSGAPWRFFTPELYVFSSAVRHGHQVYGPNSPRGHEGMYQAGNEESVAFLYMRDEAGLKMTDEVDLGNAASEKAHSVRVIGPRREVSGSWWYDGEMNNVLFPVAPIVDSGVAVERELQFRVKLDPRNQGVRLRRRTDKENNRQLARVFVDGIAVSERPWFSVDFERTFRGIRWFDSDFEIPERYTKGKRSITIRVERLSSKTGTWDDFNEWVYCYR
ncbi:MAG: DUF2961 domain-containing protein [Fimbriimonas sp.]|nr:DUF2961 domain-containing protein [Fimbriimonas sp.]